MIQPTLEQRDLLGSFERAAYDFADFWNKHMAWQARLYNSTVMMGFTWLLSARRVRVTGVENLRALDYERGILFVANHRTFYDYFGIMSQIVRNTEDFPLGILFPVRSKFFYERPLGVAVNMAMSGMAMFPPIMRDRSKRGWNDYALARCVAELEENAAVIGIHPEGKRYPDSPLFDVHRGKLGVARIALEAKSAQVVPIFMTGVTNDLLEEFRRNWMEPERYPVLIAYGCAVELDDLRELNNTRDVERQLVDRLMEAIGEMAVECRRMAGFQEQQKPAEA